MVPTVSSSLKRQLVLVKLKNLQKIGFFIAAKCIAEGCQDIFGLLDLAQCRFYSDLPGENLLIGSLSECFSKVEEILNKMQRLISIFR